MKKMNQETMKRQFAGRTYFCPWHDYQNSNYWKVYAHTVAHAYRKGWFDVPIWMIKAGLGF